MADFDNKDILYPKELREVSIRFIQIKHSPESAAKIWEEARQHDVILLEVIGLTIHEREARENGTNDVASLGDPAERKSKLGNVYSDKSFFSQIMKGAILEGKEIHFIDILDNHEANDINKEAESYLIKSHDSFSMGDFASSLLYLRNYILADNKSSQFREGVTVSQIEILLQQNQAIWKGKSICVIQGMNHTPTYHMFKRKHPETNSSRSFLNEDRFTFFLDHEARQRLYAGSKDGQELSIKRLFISRLILPVLFNDDNTEECMKKTDKLTRVLDHTNIDAIFEKLADIQKAVERELDTDTPEYIKAHIYKQVQLFAQQIIEKHPVLSKIRPLL